MVSPIDPGLGLPPWLPFPLLTSGLFPLTDADM